MRNKSKLADGVTLVVTVHSGDLAYVSQYRNGQYQGCCRISLEDAQTLRRLHGKDRVAFLPADAKF